MPNETSYPAGRADVRQRQAASRPVGFSAGLGPSPLAVLSTEAKQFIFGNALRLVADGKRLAPGIRPQIGAITKLAQYGVKAPRTDMAFEWTHRSSPKAQQMLSFRWRDGLNNLEYAWIV